MPRGAKRDAQRELPAPLPPERRTVGQLVAEAIRVYGANFLRALPLGVLLAVVDQLTVRASGETTAAVMLAAGIPLSLAYAYATRIAVGAAPPARSWIVAVGVGTLIFVPAALLWPWFKLASFVWLVLVGLAVPAAMVERLPFTQALRRGVELARVSYLHAGGALATLVVLFSLGRLGLALALHAQADAAVRTAIFLADVVLGPLVFLGAAVLYVDQEARLRSRRERGKERDADVPDADDADREGDPDPAREPRPSA